jgi:hypothetical protein
MGEFDAISSNWEECWIRKLKTHRFCTIQETKHALCFIEIPHTWLALLNNNLR